MTDTPGWRRKFAVITPSANTVVQPEYDAMRPRGVTNHIFRMHAKLVPWSTDADFLENVRLLNESIEGAIDPAVSCEPDHLILGISFESIWRGGLAASKALRERIEQRAGGGLKATLAADAVEAALKAFGVSKNIGLVTPYFPAGVTQVVAFVEETGYSVVRDKHLPTSKPSEIAHITEEALRDAFRAVDGQDVEAIVQFGANLPSLRAAAECERWLGKPVISINAATYWHALRQSGIDDSVYGLGRLLAEH